MLRIASPSKVYHILVASNFQNLAWLRKVCKLHMQTWKSRKKYLSAGKLRNIMDFGWMQSTCQISFVHVFYIDDVTCGQTWRVGVTCEGVNTLWGGRFREWQHNYIVSQGVFAPHWLCRFQGFQAVKIAAIFTWTRRWLCRRVVNGGGCTVAQDCENVVLVGRRKCVCKHVFLAVFLAERVDSKGGVTGWTEIFGTTGVEHRRSSWQDAAYWSVRPPCIPVLLFSKLNKMFFGYFDPETIFKIIKLNNFRGDLTDISTKKEALLHSGSAGFFKRIKHWRLPVHAHPRTLVRSGHILAKEAARCKTGHILYEYVEYPDEQSNELGQRSEIVQLQLTQHRHSLKIGYGTNRMYSDTVHLNVYLGPSWEYVQKPLSGRWLVTRRTLIYFKIQIRDLPS